MIAYTKEEIISSSKITRNFGEILNKLLHHKLEKVAVIRNNRIEAVILSVESYENLRKAVEMSEDLGS